MPRFGTLPTVLLFSVYITTTTSLSPPTIYARQADKCLPNFSKCPQAGLPSNFCCPAGDTCISLAANTTALCCSQGQNCGSIVALSCDINLQDSEVRPNATLKTTALDVPLAKCGSACCPHGFTCNAKSGPQGQDLCVLDKDQSVPPGGATVSSTSSLLPTPTSSPFTTSLSISITSSSTPTTAISTPDSSPSAIPQTNAPQSSCPQFPLTASLTFFFTGLVTGVISAALTCGLLGRQTRKKAFLSQQHPHPPLSRSSTESLGNHPHIGTPHLQVGYDGRVDFLNKPPGTASTAKTLVNSAFNAAHLGREKTVKRAKSIFTRSPKMGNESEKDFMNHINEIPKISPLRPKKKVRQNGVGMDVIPVTPPRQVRTQSEFGDITIGTDERTAIVEQRAWQESPQNNNTHGLGINRGSGLGVGGSAIPAILQSGKPMQQSNTWMIKTEGLQPPPMFANDNGSSVGAKEGHLTTFTEIQAHANGGEGESRWSVNKRKGHERTASGGIASLPPKGMRKFELLIIMVRD